jgi:haloalkane dehalogenase
MDGMQVAGERPSWVDDELFPFESRFLGVDGNTVHYVDEGSGPILLMLHGNPVWSFVYRDVIAQLRTRYRCIAPDLPGFGLSTASADYRYSAQEHADLLLAFVDQLDLADVTLVGHNWGGPLGLYAAGHRPGVFTHLILSNTWAWPLNGDPSSELFARGMGNPAGRALIQRFNLLTNYFIPAAHKRRTLSHAEMTHYRAATSTPQRRYPTAVLPGELVKARAFFTDLQEGLAPIRDLPTLILWADTDPIFTAKYLRRMQALFPDASTTVLKGVGHFAQSDAPGDFSEAIETWRSANANNDRDFS